ncbi:hypothetical protein J5N97_014319 [Dioscorea zingiberensis]|uniref:Cytochrome P450 n=1 Tax=Dioscorea zingiberensis TaxID=325984 RepID=A0A9D5CS42_9LILI|nr:hypothetical protein J5N97_014319 [Dioscorea zingiberensis]
METTTLPLLNLTSVFVTILTLLLLLFLRSRQHRAANHCPCTHPIIGNLIAFLANRHRFLDWATELLASSPTRTIEVRGPFGLTRGVCTAEPTVVDHLLRANFPNYVKGQRFHSVLSDLLGRGIFNADDVLWALQRKIASREFTTRSLKIFVSDSVRFETNTRLLPRLAAAADSGEALDLQDVLRRFGFDNICRVAFGIDAAALSVHPQHQQEEPFFSAFDEAVEISAARFFNPVPWLWKGKRMLNLGSERKLRIAIQAIDAYAMKIIAARREQSGDEKQDLLSRFMLALEQDDGELGVLFQDETEKTRFLRDIVISFILAGKDSTSSALTWLFWLLSMNRHCEGRIISELGDESEYDDLKGMNYLHASISEALRLYPPVPIDSRLVVADDVLPDGTEVRAGWFADYSAYAMGRMERVWGRDCGEFVPERWLDEKGEFRGVEAVKFPVFHAGPRTCLGREMAYVQMKSVVSSVLREFEVEPVVVDGRKGMPEYEFSLTLRMRGGFPVRIKRRVRA